VGEVKAVAHRAHDPPAHQFLEGLRGLLGCKPSAPLEKGKAEFTPNDGGHRGQAAARLGEALQAGRDEIPDAAGQDAARAGGARPFDELPGRLHDHERIALACPPDLFAYALDRRLRRTAPQECPDQLHGLRLGERREAQPEQTLLAVQLRERLPERPRLGQILFAGASDEEHRTLADPAADEGKEPDAHLVRPVQIVEDEQEALACGETVHDGEHRLEEAGRVPRGARRRTDLWEQAGQLGAPRP
jgi:hypothetical protein